MTEPLAWSELNGLQRHLVRLDYPDAAAGFWAFHAGYAYPVTDPDEETS